ncbi:MAG TPA: hypothetical protein VFW96_13955 [Thermomicrobiales bacterium]|nr:hypothetical protein [Thermomicrobiales bacterium]
MSGQTHAWIGLAVLVVNLVVGVAALLAARRDGKASRALVGGAYLGLALLVVQILAGLDLWTRNLRPAAGAGPTAVHVGAPLVALVVAAVVLPRARGRASRYAAVALVVFVAALVSYGIGEMRA